MTLVPLRVVGRQARVPTGEFCEGCEFLRVDSNLVAGSIHIVCTDPLLRGSTRLTYVDEGVRLPACKERDKVLAEVEKGSTPRKAKKEPRVRAVVHIPLPTVMSCEVDAPPGTTDAGLWNAALWKYSEHPDKCSVETSVPTDAPDEIPDWCVVRTPTKG